MKRSTVVSGFFFILLGIVLYQVFLILRPFLGAMFWAGIVTFACYPIHNWITRVRPKWKENTTAAVSAISILVVIVPLATWVTFTLAEQAIRFIENAREFVNSGQLLEVHEQMLDNRLLGPLVEKVVTDEMLEDPSQWTMDVIENNLGGLGSIAGTVTAVGRNVLLFLANVLLMMALVFFCFRDGKKIRDYIYNVLPLEKEQRRIIFDKIEDTLAAVIRGQFINSLVQGGFAWGVYWALGIPLPLFFGFLTMVASFIPFLGAASIWFPWAVWFVVTGATVKGIILLVAGALGISLVDNFLKPILIGTRTKIPTLLLFLGILGGLEVYGITGIFVAPILLSLMFTLVKLYREQYPELLR